MSGIAEDDNGDLYWQTTGQLVKFTHFADEVVDKTGPHPCLMIDRRTLKWHDRSCNTGGHAMCEKGTEYWLVLKIMNRQGIVRNQGLQWQLFTTATRSNRFHLI